MKYKVLVLDLDGTLTNSKKKITDYTKKNIIKFTEKRSTYCTCIRSSRVWNMADSKRVGIRKIWWLYSCV